MRALLDDGADDGIAEELIYDEGHQGKNRHSFAVKRTQDVDPVLKDNARLRALNDGYSPSRSMRRVARIPTVIILKWIEEFGYDPTAKGHEKKLWELLNSNEYAYLRTDSKPSRLFISPNKAVDVHMPPKPLVVVA